MPPAADKTVLVAADVPYTRTMLRQTLAADGCTVVVADGLESSLEALASGHFGLLVVDLARQQGGSEQLLLRARIGGNQVPALLLMSKIEVDVLRRLSNMQPVGFLAKPLKVEVLRELVPLGLAGDPGLLRRSAELARSMRQQADAEIDEAMVEDLAEERPLIDEGRLQAVFRDLPMLPHVVAGIIEVTGRESASAAQLAEVVAGDPRLAGMLLRVVNSAYFGFARRISTIPEATVILGLQAVKNLAVSAAVCNLFGGKSDLVDRAQLWRHALAVAAASRAVAQRCGYSDGEEAFAAGLLHDFGRLVLERYLPVQYGGALTKSREQQVPLLEAEQETLGITHAWVSGWLARQWNLPPVLRDSMMFHHDPEGADGAVRTAAALVHLADHLVHHAGMGGIEGVPPLTEPSPYAVETVSVPLAGLAELVPEIIKQTQALEQQLAPAVGAGV